jgi:hypothetical protein
MSKLARTLLIVAGILAFIIFSLFLWVTINRPKTKLSKTVPQIDLNRTPRLISAFFGLDNSLPWLGILISRHAPGNDGMPLVFSHEIDPSSLDKTDIEFTTLKGNKHTADFVTLLPANEEFELRTVLTIGEFGNHPDDPPVSAEIVGDLMTRVGQNLKGQTVGVTPLPEGPFLSYAEYFEFTDDYPYVAEGRGCDCPREETALVVRTVWAGGVRALDGSELGDDELENIRVTMIQGSDTVTVIPYKLADLSDNDNNIDLCLKEAGVPISVEADGNIAIDPNDDKILLLK